MDNLQIVFTAAGKMELLEGAIPVPGRGQVLIRTEVSTVSGGTERANLSGEPNVSPTRITTEAVFPRYPGYSLAGVVESVGEDVISVRPGDRVAVSWGRHARYVCVDEINVHRIEDDSVSFSDAAMAFIASFPLAAIRKCRLEIGESAVVMGQGILGQLGLQLLRAAGACPVIAVDPIPSKRERAMELGADLALDPYEADFVDRAREATHGGANVALEVTGVGKALDGVLDCMARMGRVALLGCTRRSDFSIDYYHKVHGPGISLIGAHTKARPERESSPGLWTHHDDITAILRLDAAGRIRLSDYVEETHSPADAQSVYHRLLTEPSFPVIQFDWKR